MVVSEEQAILYMRGMMAVTDDSKVPQEAENMMAEFEDQGKVGDFMLEMAKMAVRYAAIRQSLLVRGDRSRLTALIGKMDASTIMSMEDIDKHVDDKLVKA